MTDRSFTGRRRQRKTRRAVVVADRAARALISVGGAGTILAVLGVAFFLVWVVLPLFLPADVEELAERHLDWDAEPLHLGVDEYRTLGWALLPPARIEVFRLDNGERRATLELYADRRITAASFPLQGERAVLGTADGAVVTAEVGFETTISDMDDFPSEVRRRLEEAPEGTVLSFEDGVLQRTPTGQVRRQRLRVELGEEIRIGTGPVFLVRHAERTTGPFIVATALGDDGWKLLAVVGEERSSFLTGATQLEFDPPVELPAEHLAIMPPAYLEVDGTGSSVFVGWRSGELLRLATESLDDAFAAEWGRLVPEGVELTAMRFLLGNTTLIWGDSTGAVAGGFLLRREEYEGPSVPGLQTSADASRVLVATKRLAPPSGASALALAPSARSRLLFVGFADGRVRLVNVTNETELRTVRVEEYQAVTHLVMAPKEDGLVALTGEPGSYVAWTAGFDPGYPEAGLNALFRPVWYEGYNEPRHIWQSSSGTDDFEPKLGLYPLIFGTVKATLYSMLFGAPLALLAAVYTSELLGGRAKSVIKPTIELMASLPSVVLGFLAALVFAPFVEDVLPTGLALLFTVPLAFLAGAYLWQLLPHDVAMRVERWRFAAIAVAAPLGVLVALALGPRIEDVFFGGDVRAWLAWDPGGADPERFASAVGGWLLLWLPLSALLVAWFSSRWVTPRLRWKTLDWSRQRLALADGGRFLLGLVVTFGLALLVSAFLDGLGLDPRGSYVDTYVQRNALIVGFVMGFAIIPIIYTISEDALSTVPEHLRSASLGAGATPWQTAVRIVIPTAMSGLFSALMVGLGRAVGETMIVLMAAGNTPVMDWNVFEGFRTLSANIAVELPEAVRGSTHYRTLFLAALVLFVMTFLVNTVAEVIRQRFRKRAYQL